MKDPANPTSDEIEEWARTPGAMYPMEDWDLIIADDENAVVFSRLAADPSCVNRGAILNFLYVYTGQVIRGGARANEVANLQMLIERANAADLDDVRLWAKRATTALGGSGPSPRAGAGREDYEFWFGRGWRKAID